MSGRDDPGHVGNSSCGREECLANLVRIRDLQEDQDELWARLVDFSNTESELVQQVKSLEGIVSRLTSSPIAELTRPQVASRSKKVAALEDEVEGCNEQLYAVTLCHEQCKSDLEAEIQRHGSEKTDLEGQIAAMLETNTELLSRLVSDRGSVSDRTQAPDPASSQSFSRRNEESHEDCSPPSPSSVSIVESEARPSLQEELMLASSSDASEMDWWAQDKPNYCGSVANKHTSDEHAKEARRSDDGQNSGRTLQPHYGFRSNRSERDSEQGNKIDCALPTQLR
ncbi:hypothetical protein N0V95_010065 [Ascochyta clinopodiicola]|nr:hypothetical protein N0V95_010065 [Ascochyta clinopodiicola]